MNKKFEFSYISQRERYKIIAAKVVLALVGLGFSAMMIDITSRNLETLAGLLGCFYLYLNILDVRSELTERFEPPWDLRGNEIAHLATCLFVASFFVE